MKLISDFPNRVKYSNRFVKELSQLISNGGQIAKGISGDEQVSLLQGGYQKWQELLQKYYPSFVSPWIDSVVQPESAPLTKFLHQRFLHYPTGVDTNMLSESIHLFAKALEEESPFVFQERTEFTDLFFTAVQESLSRLFGFDPNFGINYSLFPWRFYYYDLQFPSISQSNKWHYDLEIADNIFFAMLYLNDAPGFGTGVYDYSSSRAISEELGYISSPPALRASSLDYYHKSNSVTEPVFIDAKAGDMLLFCPSRCFHKGILPVTPVSYSRKIIHFSFSILPKDGVEYSSLPLGVNPFSLQQMSHIMPIGRSFAPYWQ